MSNALHALPTATVAVDSDARAGNAGTIASAVETSATSSETSAEFMSRHGVRLLSGVLRAGSALSPRLGGRLAYEILSRPPRFRARPREQAVYASARHLRVRHGTGYVKVYQWGEGPTVLLVHCWGGRATQLHALIESLVASGFRVVSFDGPAHGESDGRRTDMFDFAEASAAVARIAGPLEAIVAHSFGAAAALIAQRQFELSANRYVLISMFRSCDWFIDAFSQYFSVQPAVIDQMRSIYDRLRGEPVDWSELCMQRIISDITAPILLMHDRSDREIPFEHAELLQGSAREALLHATDGLGHRRILRSPEVIERIQRFLSDQGQHA